MATLTPTSVIQSPFRTDDIREVIAQMVPAYRRSIDVEWLRACYALVYGTTEVGYLITDDGPRWNRPIRCGTVEAAMQALGPTDILTWGVWLLIDRSMHAQVPAPEGRDGWSWQAIAATATAA